MASMKAHNTTRTETYRAIKTAFTNWETAKENAGKTLTEADEINILKKMVKQREDSMNQYFEAHRDDLAYAEADQITIIKEFLPAEATEEDIKNWFDTIVAEGLEPIKKNMGLFVKQIKADLPNADGKMIAQFVQSHLN
jgi:uncharacterized protein YqeY